MNLYQQVRKIIESEITNGNLEFVIFPFGEVGLYVLNILRNVYGIEPVFICDNSLCFYNTRIQPLSVCRKLNIKNVKVILSCTNTSIYDSLKEEAIEYFGEKGIIELPEMQQKDIAKVERTKCGKYSYGPLCNHRYVESVGAFCSFANGTDVVINHAMDYISTHPFIYYDKSVCQYFDRYSDHKDDRWYFYLGESKKPMASSVKVKRVVIGNDVWLGHNVLITNGAKIGNGVIAGAGAVITKDIPDYAVVVGAPARILKYRYSEKQIEALNRICWWDWTDYKIRESYSDFFISIDQFIKKYDC